MTLDLSRRNFIRGTGTTLIAAPAIVRIASIMPVRAMRSQDAMQILEDPRAMAEIEFMEDINKRVESALWRGGLFNEVHDMKFTGLLS